MSAHSFVWYKKSTNACCMHCLSVRMCEHVGLCASECFVVCMQCVGSVVTHHSGQVISKEHFVSSRLPAETKAADGPSEAAEN